MKPVNLHAHEDRLLELAYGELPPGEAQAVQAHVASCARCAQELDAIRGVRQAMAPLAAAPAPDAGLDSLLAYAQQTARRAAAGPERTPGRWRRWFLPVVGVASLATAAVLVVRVESAKAPEAAAIDVAAKQDAMAQVDAELASRRQAEQERKLEAASAQAAEAAAPSAPPAPSKSVALKDAAKAESDYVPVKLKKGSGGSRSMMGRGEGSGGPGPLAEAEAPMGNAEVAYAPPPADEAGAGPQASDDAQPGSVSRDLDGRGAEAREEAPAAVASAAPAPAPARTSGAVRNKTAVASKRAAEVAAPAVAQEEDAVAQRSERTLGGVVGGVSAPAEPAAPAPSAPASAAPAPTASVATLSTQARAARQQGDRNGEARLLRAALAAGASGTEQLGLLDRLCDAELALGRAAGARDACGALVQLAPDSAQARSARKRLAEAGLAVPAN